MALKNENMRIIERTNIPAEPNADIIIYSVLLCTNSELCLLVGTICSSLTLPPTTSEQKQSTAYPYTYLLQPSTALSSNLSRPL